jgi:hypothetical protein
MLNLDVDDLRTGKGLREERLRLRHLARVELQGMTSRQMVALVNRILDEIQRHRPQHRKPKRYEPNMSKLRLPVPFPQWDPESAEALLRRLMYVLRMNKLAAPPTDRRPEIANVFAQIYASSKSDHLTLWTKANLIAREILSHYPPRLG